MNLARSSADTDTLLTVLDFLSERWVLLAINSLMSGARHFNELGRDCGGASGKVLIQKLEKMEGLGIVNRTVLSVTPPRTLYTLTPAGLALQPTIEALDQWARRYLLVLLNWTPDNQPATEPENPIQFLQQKWAFRIVYALLTTGSSGYNELGRAVGVNVTTLGHRLRELEEVGILTKTVLSVQPLKHEYALTESGKALNEIIRAVASWTNTYRSQQA